MEQKHREEMFKALMRGVRKDNSTPAMYKQLSDMTTKDIDAIEPIVDRIVGEAIDNAIENARSHD